MTFNKILSIILIAIVPTFIFGQIDSIKIITELKELQINLEGEYNFKSMKSSSRKTKNGKTIRGKHGRFSKGKYNDQNLTKIFELLEDPSFNKYCQETFEHNGTPFLICRKIERFDERDLSFINTYKDGIRKKLFVYHKDDVNIKWNKINLADNMVNKLLTSIQYEHDKKLKQEHFKLDESKIKDGQLEVYANGKIISTYDLTKEESIKLSKLIESPENFMPFEDDSRWILNKPHKMFGIKIHYLKRRYYRQFLVKEDFIKLQSNINRCSKTKPELWAALLKYK